MLRRYVIAGCLLLLLGCCWPVWAGTGVRSGASDEYVMPKKDGNQGDKSVDRPLVFYDMGGPDGNVPSYYAGKTCFVAADPGKQIQILFESLELQGEAALYVYDGDIKFDSYNDTPPQEQLLAVLSGSVSGRSFVSSKGRMAVLYVCQGNGSGAGWKALVQPVVPKEMELLSCNVTQEGAGNAYIGAKRQPLLLLDLQTEGIQTPLMLDEVGISFEGVSDLSDLESVEIYASDRVFTPDRAVLLARISDIADAVTFTGLGRQLLSGENCFWVTADLKSDAVPGHHLDAVATSVIVSGQERLSAPVSPEGVVSIENKVLMSREPATYTVGEHPVMFYDDGGPSGKISENFSGSVTFRPQSSQEKVMIEFTAVDLFESSNKNEILQVYNGPESSPENLILRVRSGKPVTVRSTAPGGELTVTLTADTGFPKDGFEAVVSQFLPQAMVLDGVDVSACADAPACAGGRAPVLKWNVRTSHTEPPLQADRFSFSSAGTSEWLDRAIVYFSGRSDQLSDTVRIGQAEVHGDKFSVAASSGISLAEGDNYFWLAYDIAGQTPGGQQVDASLDSLVLSGQAYPVQNGNPEGALDIENVCYARLGHTSYKVYDSWEFRSEPNPSPYYSGYDPEEGARIVTFEPGVPGTLVELDFSAFELYYAASAYGVQARFEVYSGIDTQGELLWRLDNADAAKKGPGHILRSSTPDGAITVVFDTRSGSSAYTAKGFQATVRASEPKPMQVKSVRAFQSRTGVVRPGAEGLDLAGFVVTAEGDRNPVSLETVELDFGEGFRALRRVTLYGGSRDSVLVQETPLAQALVGDSRKLILDVTASTVLPEGDSYYWLVVDLASDAEPETVVDVVLTSVVAGGKKVVPANGDPEGHCVVRNIYCLQAGDNGSVTVGRQPLQFYDVGGPEEDTPKGFSGQITFVPEIPGEVIRLDFQSWNINGNDKMLFYYGDSVTDSEDLKYSRTSQTDPVISKAADGSLTVRFVSPSYAYPSEGWSIQVSSYTLQELAVGGISVSPQSNVRLLRGMEDVPLLRIDVDVRGDKGCLDLTALTVGMSGSGVLEGLRIFATDTVSTFAPVHAYGEVGAGQEVCTGSYPMTQSGVYRFWLTGRVSSDAVVGSAVTASVSRLTVAGTDFPLADARPFEGKVSAGFSGSYTLGDGGDYPGFAQAVSAMEDGIDGPVVFSVVPGDYPERVLIPEIPGASVRNTITFRSATGDWNDVCISSDQYSAPDYSDDKMFYEYGVFTIAGADYVILDGLSFTTRNLEFPSVVHIKNESRHITLRNCRVYAPMSENYGQDINLVYQYAQNLPNRNNDFMTVENCLLEGGYIGIRLAGTIFRSLPKQTGGRIVGNTLRNQGSKAVYVTGEENLVLERNVIENTETSKGDFNALDITSFQGLSVSGNIIRLQTHNYASALFLRSASGSADAPAYIRNNEIYMEGAEGGLSYGLRLKDTSEFLKIAHNTVRMVGSQVVPLDISSGLKDSELYNNIWLNESGGYVYRVGKEDYLKGVTCGHNVWHTSGNPVAWVGRDVASFDEWCRLSGESGSYFEPVSFLSDEILEPAVPGHLVSGIRLDYVPEDLNGMSRASVPTVGAYEYLPEGQVPALQEGYPLISGINDRSATLRVRSTVNGAVYSLVRRSTDARPALAEMLEGERQAIRSIEEASFTFSGLDERTSYIAYVLLENLRGVRSEVLASRPFTTSSKPTEVSTFEQVTPNGTGFEDGTAAFEGFTVVEAADCVVPGNKVARVDGTGTVYLLNSPVAIPLNGFYLKAAGTVEMRLYDENRETGCFSLESTAGKWVFVNLKDKGAILSLTLSATAEAFIDNFSGVPQDLFVYVPDCRVEEGAQVTLDATVAADRGVAPYRYEWKNRAGETVSSEAAYRFAATVLEEFSVTVTDAWGQVASDRVMVQVEGEPRAATFEEMELQPEGYWNGERPEDAEKGAFSFQYSGSYLLSVMKHTESWWSGFAWSNQTSTEFGSLDDQYRSAAGGGHRSENYIVAYVDSWTPNYIEVTNRKAGDVLHGFYITNAAYTRSSILDGDAFATPFGKGDYLKLIVTGKHADTTVSTLEYYLADYRGTSEADWYCLDTWEWVDLKPLGAVTQLTFSFEGSKNTQYGLATPTYFCMDDLNALQRVDASTIGSLGTGRHVLRLAQFFEGFSEEAQTTYSLVDVEKQQGMEIQLEGSTLVVQASQHGEAVVLLRGIQRGKDRLVRLTVSADASGISDPASESEVKVYPVPAVDHLTVETDGTESRLELFTLSGVRVMECISFDSVVELPVGQYPRGTYLLRVASASGTTLHRILLVGR